MNSSIHKADRNILSFPDTMMKNLRLLLNTTTVVLFLVLALQTCIALPLQVFFLTAGIIILGALAYLALAELLTLVRLETQGQLVKTATVVDIRQNSVGWQRLQVNISVPEGGTIKKWMDDTTSTKSISMCQRYRRQPYHPRSVGDVVTVRLSKDWKYCRLHESDDDDQATLSSSFSCTCRHVGTIMTILSLGAIVATGKMFVLVFLLVTQRACGETCTTFRCEDEFETRMLYACLVGATVYTDIFFVVKQRYFDSFPSLTDVDFQRTDEEDDEGSRLLLLPEVVENDDTKGFTSEMTVLTLTSTESTESV